MALSYTHVCDFSEKDTAYARAWQYDYGKRVELIGDGIDETLTVQWHYNGIAGVVSSAITKTGTQYFASIPDAALEQTLPVYGYIYCTGTGFGYTAYKIELAIRERFIATEEGPGPLR